MLSRSTLNLIASQSNYLSKNSTVKALVRLAKQRRAKEKKIFKIFNLKRELLKKIFITIKLKPHNRAALKYKKTKKIVNEIFKKGHQKEKLSQII